MPNTGLYLNQFRDIAKRCLEWRLEAIFGFHTNSFSALHMFVFMQNMVEISQAVGPVAKVLRKMMFKMAVNRRLAFCPVIFHTKTTSDRRLSGSLEVRWGKMACWSTKAAYL